MTIPEIKGMYLGRNTELEYFIVSQHLLVKISVTIGAGHLFPGLTDIHRVFEIQRIIDCGGFKHILSSLSKNGVT